MQLLVERNHNKLLFPGWSNTSDFANTPETFGTVALHSPELAEVVSKIEVGEEVKLTSDQRYLCAKMGTKLPFLPVHGEPNPNPTHNPN